MNIALDFVGYKAVCKMTALVVERSPSSALHSYH